MIKTTKLYECKYICDLFHNDDKSVQHNVRCYLKVVADNLKDANEIFMEYLKEQQNKNNKTYLKRIRIEHCYEIDMGIFIKG